MSDSSQPAQTAPCFIMLNPSGRPWISDASGRPWISSAMTLHEVGPEVHRRTGLYLPTLIASGYRIVSATLTWTD